jgi:hypothetical protein
MRDVRRLAREKAARHDADETEGLTSDTTVPTTVLTPVDTTVTTPARTTVTKEEGYPIRTTVPTTVGATVPTTVNLSPASSAEASVDAPQRAEDPFPGSSENQARNAAQPQYLDATHTASEQRVYSLMYRETISKGMRERHYGPKELCAKTGIRSDRTIRMAVRGLVQKFSIEIVSHGAYFPQGPRYRVIEPREVLRRRRAAGMEIDPQTKKILTPAGATVATPVATVAPTPVATQAPAPVDTVVDGGGKNYRSTPVEITGVTPVEITGVYNKEEKDIGGGDCTASSSSSNKQSGSDDDEAFAALNSALKDVTKEVTGREPSASDAERWRELAELLTTELKIAAARTDSVSNVPAFLTEHLRRRLWKKDKRELEGEAEAAKDAPSKPADVSKCPDCAGTGFYYPGGYEGGVARCRHERLTETQ